MASEYVMHSFIMQTLDKGAPKCYKACRKPVINSHGRTLGDVFWTPDPEGAAIICWLFKSCPLPSLEVLLRIYFLNKEYLVIISFFFFLNKP